MKVVLTREEQSLLEQIQVSEEKILQKMRDWSLINSGSHNAKGLQEQMQALLPVFGELGGKLEQVPLPPSKLLNSKGHEISIDNQPALRVVQRPEAPVQVLLTGHYDTVFPAESSFQDVKEIDGDTWNGPGLADMKGGLLVMHQALMALEQSSHASKIGYTVLISPDEETGSLGSAGLLANHAKTADLGMTYEPGLADGSLSGARKGSGNFSLLVTGKAAHAGRDHHLGRNAIVAASIIISKLADMSGLRAGLTVNPSKLEGGGAYNVVPDTAIVRFNVRLQETEDMHWFAQQLTRLIDETNQLDGICVTQHGGFTRPPKPMAPANAAIFSMTRAAGAALGLDIKWKSTGGVCEGNNLWAQGCPNVDTLGVRGGAIHSDQEYVILSSLVERVKLSAVMLFKFASGEFDAKSLRKLLEREAPIC